MPRVRKTERVIIVRTDLDGNIIDYDVVEQPIRSGVVEKSASVSHSSSVRQSPRLKRMETSEKKREYDIDYEDNVAVFSTPLKKTRQDTTPRTSPKVRRVRYIRPKSTVKIFEEKVDWYASPRIDTHNEELIKRINNTPTNKIFREKLDWRVKPRIDSHNEEIVKNSHRSTIKPEIFNEKPVWNAGTKIDSHNEQVIERLKTAPKPTIYNEKPTWQPNVRIDHHNEEYIKHKEREKIIQREKTFVQNFKHDWQPREDRIRVDHHNPLYDEHRKRRKSAILPPIEDRKLEWSKRSRINQKNDDYIEHIRRKQSTSMIFREKLRWRTKTPKIETRNEEYVEHLKGQIRPKILNHLPRWKSESKIDTYNDEYDSTTSHERPIIVSEKLHWHARPKIDTGLEPESEEEEYDDNDSTA